jgi:hypothetical protein
MISNHCYWNNWWWCLVSNVLINDTLNGNQALSNVTLTQTITTNNGVNLNVLVMVPVNVSGVQLVITWLLSECEIGNPIIVAAATVTVPVRQRRICGGSCQLYGINL